MDSDEKSMMLMFGRVDLWEITGIHE